jgi:hypothetical protein
MSSTSAIAAGGPLYSYASLSVLSQKKAQSGSLSEECDIWETTFKEFESLGCPFERRVNPHAEEAEKAVIYWAKDMGIPALESHRFAYLMAGAYPDCSSELLTLFTCWVTMLFEYDDRIEKVLCKDPARLEAFNNRNLMVLHGTCEASANDDALTRAIFNLRKRFEQFSTLEWRRRFVRDFEEYLHANEWESDKNGIPDMDTFLKMRPLTAGVYLMFDLGELAGATVSEYFLESEYFKELRRLCNNGVWLPNDIVSYPKEAKGTGNNIIHIFMEKEHCSLPEAIQKTKQLCLQERAQIQSMLENMPIGYRNEEKKLVNGLLYWIRSNFDWSRETLRYKKPRVPLTWQKA